MNIQKIQAEFLENMDIKDNSRYIYEKNLHPFWVWVFCNNINMDNIERKDIINYKSYLRAKYKSIYTIRNYMNTVKQLFLYLERSGIYDNITLGIKQIKHKNEITKFPLYKEDIKKLLEKIDLSSKTGKRDRLIIETMIILGLRVNELRNLNINDIEKINDVHVIRIKGKGYENKSQFLKLDSILLDKLKEYISYRDHGQYDPIFVTINNKRMSIRAIQKLIQIRLKNAGFMGHIYSAHSLRHTTATLLVMDNMPLENIRDYMRHTDIKTTEKYLKHIRRYQALHNHIGNSISSVLDH